MKEIPSDLIDEYRNINIYSGWNDYEYDEFVADMATYGVEIKELFLDTSFCQGSGASCVGYVDPLAFIRAHGLNSDEHDDDYGVARIVLERDADAFGFALYLTDYRYTHELAVGIKPTGGMAYPSDIFNTDGPLMAALVPQWDRVYEAQVTNLADNALCFVRERLVEYHSRMEDLVLELTSDEAVEDFIRHNIEEYMDDAA